ncbi:alpha/beta fold hydrolase [Prosthecomicrobium sp. N25]|uniref:alpha/beta fold hydrolase n=1 Tax=Prosthecomicrobium sp. N25 TaxID=3129254 RepID=UPI003076F159
MSNLPLLMIPGLNCTASLWSEQIDALGAGRTLVVADQTGHDSMAGLAASILADAPPRFALAGLSMGGYIAFEILRQAPHRVERLALLDTQARADTDETRQSRRQQIEIAWNGGFARIPDLQLPRLLSERGRADPALVALVRRMAEATGRDGFIRQQSAILGRPDSRPDLARIACPTLVLVGEQDAITPPDLAREMHQGIPGSRLVVVPGAGHLSTLEAPEPVSTALGQWLDA